MVAPHSNLASRMMRARRPDEAWIMAHSPEGKRASAGAVPPAVLEGAVLLHVDEVLHVLHVQRAVDLELGVEPRHAVGLGGEGHVVDGAELLELRPRRPGGGQSARRRVRRLDFLRRRHQLGPGLRRLGGIEPRLLEGVLVVEHDGRRAVERHRHHAAVGQAVVALHRGHVRVGVESHARLAHQLVHRLHRAARGHHRRGADLEHLHDVRRVAGPEGGDGPHHGLGVRALEARVDLILGLRCVEVRDDLLEQSAQRLPQAVPELDLDPRLRAGRQHGGEDGDGQDEAHEERRVSTSHAGSPLLARFSVSTGGRTYRPAPARILMHPLDGRNRGT